MKLEHDGKSLHLEGRLDIHSVKEALASFKGLGARDCKRVDVKGLELLDTAGVQWLYWLAQRHGGTLEVVNASKAVKATLKSAGFEPWVAS